MHAGLSLFSGRPDDPLGACFVAQRGRVYFAGEHTAPWNGWMEGALWSGERVAQEILQQ
jgi:monoamine oxidase